MVCQKVCTCEKSRAEHIYYSPSTPFLGLTLLPKSNGKNGFHFKYLDKGKFPCQINGFHFINIGICWLRSHPTKLQFNFIKMVFMFWRIIFKNTINSVQMIFKFFKIDSIFVKMVSILSKMESIWKFIRHQWHPFF